MTDDDSETGEAALALTVGPKDLLRQAIELLESYEGRSKNVSDGIDRIQDALDDRYWADVIRGTGQHGHSIFDRLEQGIRKLDDGGKHGGACAPPEPLRSKKRSR